MRGIIEVDCKCKCAHRQSDHINGRINTGCTVYGCHCSTFIPDTLNVVADGKFVRVLWIDENES